MAEQKAGFASRVERFFFEPEVPYGLALCRIGIPMALMGMILPRWHVVRELFSTDGAPAQLSVGYGFGKMFPEFSAPIAVALYAVLLFSMICVSIGWCTRIALISSAILFTYFTMLDYVSTMTKYTVIATHILTILSVSHCGSLWSVDAWLAGRKRNHWPGEPAVTYERFPAWPRRLMQLFIGVVYFGAAITKVHTPLFFTGDMLQYWMQTHINYGHPIGEFVSLYPILLVAFAYVTIVWEFMFIFLAWKGSWRLIVLPVGVLFHFMTTLTLGLIIFPMVCYCTYLSFLDEEDIQQTAAWFRRLCRKDRWARSFRSLVEAFRARMGNPVGWQTTSKAAFVFSLVLFCVASVEIEYWLDIYGERRPEGRYALTPIDPQVADKLTAPTEQMRLVDKFFAIDTGTILVGDRLANRRTEFRHGELMIAQCNLIPPHEDMYIECKLQNDENRLVDSLGTVATREMFRANFHYQVVDGMPPGDYSLVIESAGRPIMRKKIKVLPRHGTASAN